AVDITANSVAITVADGSFGATNTTAGNAIQTNVADLSITSTSAGGNQFILESTGLSEISLNAGANSIQFATAASGSVLSTDGLVDIVATTATITLASGSFGASSTTAGNAIQTNVTNLSVTTSGGNGSQFIRESSGLDEILFDAGSGSVSLATESSGDILSADSAVDIIAATATFTVASGAFGTTSTAAGSAIETNVTNLNVTTSGGNGNQFIRETDGLADLNLAAGNGSITLETIGIGDVRSADTAVDIAASTATITVFSGAFGTTNTAAGNAIETNVSVLTVTSTATGGDQFIRELNGLTELSLNAGSNAIELATANSGDLLSGDGTVDIVATTATITVASGSFGSTSTTAGNAIQTNVTNLSVNTSGGGGNQFVLEADGLDEILFNAGAGNVTVTNGSGSILSSDAAVDVIAVNATITVTSGAFGTLSTTAGRAIQTTVSNLTVTTSGGTPNQFILESDGLSELNLNAGAGTISLQSTTGSVLSSDIGVDIVASTARITVTSGAFGATSTAAGAAIETNVSDLTVTSSGNQFIRELDGLAELNLTASGNSIQLATVGAGSILSPDTDADITAMSATITVANGSFGSTSTSVGQAIQTSVASLSVTSTGTGGDQFIRELDGLTELDLNAGTNNVQFVTASTGNVLSADLGVDIVAATASITVTNGSFGSTNTNAGNAIETNIENLTVATSSGNGNQFIRESNGLSEFLLDAGTANVSLATVGNGDVLSGDSATDITAAVVSITVANGAFGSTSTTSGNAIETSVSDLSVNTSGGNGNQFIREASSLAELNLNAGTGGIQLLLASGNLLSDDVGVDVTGGTVAITITNGTFGDTDTAAGNAIETSVDDLSVTTSGGNRNQFIRESNGLTRFALNAGTGDVQLLGVAGNLLDDDANVDVTATAFAASTLAGSLGQASSLINASIINFEASVTASPASGGGVFLSDASAMTIGGALTGMTGVSATGSMDIRSFGTLSVNENVSAGGAVTLQARETGATATGDILAISSGISVSATGGSVTLNAGDAVQAAASTTITASTTIVVNIDNGAGALGADDDAAAGGVVDFDTPATTPSTDPVFVAPSGMTVNGGVDDDRFDLKPQAGAVITVNGAPPSYPTVPGDTLNFDLADVANGKAILTLGDEPGAGFYSFLAPETEKIVQYRSIETVNTPIADFKYHLVLDMKYSGFEDGSDDEILAQRTATDFRLDLNGAFFYTGNHNSILSFTIIGSSDDDYLEILETANGLPQFTAAAPVIDNSAIGGGKSDGSQLLPAAKEMLDLQGLTPSSESGWSANDATIHFDGGDDASDNDEIEMTLADQHLVFTVGSAALGNLIVRTYDLLDGTTTAPVDGLVSFAHLGTQQTLLWNGGGGAILLEAFSTPDTTTLTFKDTGTATDGYNRVEGDGGFINQTFSGFEWAYVLGGNGAEKITLESADAADVDGISGPGQALVSITLDGDNIPSVGEALLVSPQSDGTIGDDLSADILTVESVPATITATLLGGAGNDEFRIYFDNNTESPSDDTTSLILGQVWVSPQGLDDLGDGSDETGGTDTLRIRDFGDSSADTVSVLTRTATVTRVEDGEIVEGSATVTDIDSLFDSGTGVDISFSLIEVLVLDLGTAGDTVNINFGGLSDELDSATISGNAGADVFNVLTNTASSKATATILNGNAGDDRFVFSNGAVLLGAASRLDGGTGNDTLDFAAYQSSRNIYLTNIGPTDGYQGYESGWTTGAAFRNLDALVGTGQTADFLYGPNRNTTWGLTGANAGKVTDGVAVTLDPICICGDTTPTGPSLIYDLDFTAIENLRGGSLQDWFDVAMTFSLSGSLGGGGQSGTGDSLDYRDWTTAVAVDLTAGTATAIAGGLAASVVETDMASSVENVWGGSVADTLVGDSAANLLYGFAGADTLNGKAGIDTVDG
ncbi:MAG: beta strand repeat-containing protein, partial [Planctomycetota bacterium]